MRGFFLSSIKRLDSSFAGLFDGAVRNGDEPGTSETGGRTFADHYGWIYSTQQVAEFERISLEQSYELPILQYLNDLVYIKAKRDYDNEMIEKLKR